MNFMSRILRTTGLKMMAMSGGGGFEGAQNGRRLKLWNATAAHVNSLLSAQGETLRSRSRHIVRTVPLATNGSETYSSYAVGDGIRLMLTAEDEILQKQARKLWRKFVGYCDADCAADFHGLTSLAATADFEAGELFYRFRPRRSSDGLEVPLQIQTLESEMLPYRSEHLPNGNTLRCGIEFNGIGQRVAYHFYRSHPGDHTDLKLSADLYTRVPAHEVLHVYRVERPGQIRGIPKVSPSLVRLYLLDMYDDAELERKKTAALFTGFITQQLDEGQGADQIIAALKKTDVPGVADYALEPGTLNMLRPGESFESSQPADVGGNYDAFMYENKTSVVAGWGLPYGAVTGDYRKTSYSSERAADLVLRRKMKKYQKKTLIFKGCQPIAERFFDTAQLSGALNIPLGQDWRDLISLVWILPAWPGSDPVKDRKSQEIALDNNIISQSEWIMSEGGDPDEVFEQIAKDNKKQISLGIEPPTKQRSEAARMPDPEPIEVEPEKKDKEKQRA